MAQNPYAAPTAAVEDVRHAADDESAFVPDGTRVPAGHGVLWLKVGWQMFMMQPLAWIGLVVVFGLIVGLVQIIPFIGALAGFFLTPILLAGIMFGCRDLDEGDSLRVGHLFSAFGQGVGPLLLLGLLQLVAMVGVMFLFAIFGGLGMGMMGMGGYAALGVMGVVGIVVGVTFLTAYIMASWFAVPLVVFNELTPLAALNSSFRACLKNWLPFTVYGLIGLVVLIPLVAVIGIGTGIASMGGRGTGMIASMLLGFLFFMLAGLVLGPITFGSIYASYRDVFYEE